MSANEKTCGKCRTTYRKAAGSERAFDPHDGKPDGLQPFCRTCDWDAKHQPHRGWKRLRADGRGIIVGITEFEYRQIIERNRCHWCRGRLFRWGGYWIDRIDSSGHYDRSNVVACCQWCNRYKNDLPPEVFRVMIDSLIARFGIGDGESRWFDWESLGKKYRCTRPDLARLVVRNTSQADMFAVGGRR